MIRSRARLLTLFLVSSLATAAAGQEVSVQNDSLQDGGSAFICPCFVAGEEAAVWLTSPCTGDIVAVQVFWLSNTGGSPAVLQDSIRIYEPGNFPSPGPIMINGNGWDAEFVGPALQDGGLNEFRFLDDQQAVPLSIAVEAGQTFVVSLKFGETNAGDIFAPSVASDFDGCQAGKNAVFAIPGGWTNACSLLVSGDWIIRAIVDCGVGGEGGCCLPDETCEVLEDLACDAAGGVYLGNGSDCGASCPDPVGGCCNDSGICVDGQSEAECNATGGVWQGAGSDCDDPCVVMGACCFTDPEGCTELTESTCMLFGGTFQGLGTACADIDCNPIGACCFADGTCGGDLLEETCVAFGGVFQGGGTTCKTVSCPQPLGACCGDNGVCAELPEATCTGIPGAVWGGAGTTCDEGACAPDCPADVNGDQVVDVQDLVEVITDWGGTIADVTGDGTVDVQDLVAVITNWGEC